MQSAHLRKTPWAFSIRNEDAPLFGINRNTMLAQSIEHIRPTFEVSNCMGHGDNLCSFEKGGGRAAAPCYETFQPTWKAAHNSPNCFPQYSASSLDLKASREPLTVFELEETLYALE